MLNQKGVTSKYYANNVQTSKYYANNEYRESPYKRILNRETKFRQVLHLPSASSILDDVVNEMQMILVKYDESMNRRIESFAAFHIRI